MIDIALLDAAIWSCRCQFCGAGPDTACRQRSRGAHPNASTISPHMVRVRAGHAKLKESSGSSPTAPCPTDDASNEQ